MTSFFKTPKHPHAYTLELFRLALEHLPPTFAGEKRRRYGQQLEFFRKHPETTYEEIQRTIASLGKDSWAVRKAYEDMYVRYGRASEEAHLLENLDRGIREKYERFIHEGGKIGHVEKVRTIEELMAPSPFERYFTPEEKFAIEQALLKARDAARDEIDSLVRERKMEEYEALVGDYREKQRVIEGKIDELRKLAEVSPKWRAEISDRIRTLEEGWSVVERGFDVDELDRETEHWKGTLEAFLHA